MAVLVAEKLLTADEFMQLDIDHAELVDGKVVELMPPLLDHGRFQGDIYMALRLFLRRNSLGEVFAEGCYRLPSGDIRAPDVSFLSHEALKGKRTDVYFDGVPTLAVEIMSKNDSLKDATDKADEYLEAGTSVVWIVNPSKKAVVVRTPDAPDKMYGIGQSIPGGEILPGFELPVAEIFE